MNMLWISRPFNSRGIVDLRDPGLVRSVIDTLNCSASTCERRNPYSLDPAGNISALLLLPPELFAAWLNKLPMELLVKLPMHQLLGADWLTTVNRRLPLCSTAFDDVHDVSLAQEALRKHLR